MSNAKNHNCCGIDILQCFIGVDGGAVDSGGEVVVVVLVGLVLMVEVVGYLWWQSGSGSGGDSL